MNPKFVRNKQFADINSFTSDLGVKIRGLINSTLRKIGKKMVENDKTNPKNIVVEKPLSLPDDEPHIFAATHGFPEDVAATVCNLDRHAYILTNSVDQLIHNPDMCLMWLNGKVFVDTRDTTKSTKEAVPKMVRILNLGTSILIYPEGSWNVSENVLVNKLFKGVYDASKETKKKVVPIGLFHAHGSKNIYISFGEPINMYDYTMEEGLEKLRTEMATLKYDLITKYGNDEIPLTDQVLIPDELKNVQEKLAYENGLVVKRSSLPKDPRIAWLEAKKKEVLQFKWINPDWEDEYLTLDDKLGIKPEKVWKFLDKLELNKNNAFLARAISERKKEEEYNLVKELQKIKKMH